jgi:hypothetical protein
MFLIFFVVSYSQCNDILSGHHCVLEIIWLVISWYLSYHLSFQKNMGVLNFFLCVYNCSKFSTGCNPTCLDDGLQLDVGCSCCDSCCHSRCNAASRQPPVSYKALFMDDNARPHRSRAATAYPQSEVVTSVLWPTMSPDLNPIEHI